MFRNIRFGIKAVRVIFQTGVLVGGLVKVAKQRKRK